MNDMEVYFYPQPDVEINDEDRATGRRPWFLYNPDTGTVVEFESEQKCREFATQNKAVIDTVANAIYASSAPEPMTLKNGLLGLALYADGFLSADGFRNRFLNPQEAVRAWREPSGVGEGAVHVSKLPDA